MIRLRAHHGMCLAFFQGQGYSGTFTQHLARVLETLRREDPPVLLWGGADEICRCCPNDAGGACTAREKVERYDRAVLERCGLSPGQCLPWSEFAALVDRHILAPGLRRTICGDCQWDELCHAPGAAGGDSRTGRT